MSNNFKTKNIFNFLSQGLDLDSISQALERFEWPQIIYHLTGSQKVALAANLLSKKPGLILTYSDDQAQKWVNDLRTWLPGQEILLLPNTEWLPFEMLGRSRETTAGRIKVLSRIIQDNNLTVVAPILAIERRLFPVERWRRYTVEFQVGGSYSLQELVTTLVTAGYERQEIVEGKGQFALRGGILDIAPLDRDPIRIEFFDDEVDSIRTFNLDSQKSVNSLDKVVVSPVLEYILSPNELQDLRWQVKAQGRKVVSKLTRSGRMEVANKLTKKVNALEESLSQGILDENLYSYLSLTSEQMVDFFTYLSEDRFTILDEPIRLKEQMDFQQKERSEEFLDRVERGEEFYSSETQFLTYEDVLKQAHSRPLLGFSTLIREAPGIIPKRIFNQTARPLTGFMGKTSALVEEIEHRLKTGYVVCLFAGDREHADRLIQGLKDRGLAAHHKSLEDEISEGNAYIFPYSLDQGFELPLSKLIVLSETEIYKRDRKQQTQKKIQPTAKKAQLQFSDLKPGDYVVHVHHGIGQFLGIERLSVGGVEKDYFAVKYAGEDKLFVPLDQLNFLQKYLGSDAETIPKLYKLGGNEWNKVKHKARGAVKEMAIDLVKLYAQREAAKGYAFSPDNVWQAEFEEKFPYEETPDQLQSIIEVKQDMMHERPMDRLLCGDVGYGKTEVALRAAFKAVTDSKQVAILVPTTILAQQHFNTFRGRFMGYPMTVEMLSRFRSPKEQKVIIKGIKEGSIDVIVGTHRLLSDEIKFKDLGLLIIDEEQRFGVAHKEKIKNIKANVDVLTLSATPIPRTLHMSLVGVRDMSVIETPPEDRYPVQTYVAEYQPELVRDAIRREIQRGGQVFYVHNRVEDMEQVVHYLSKLVPEARYGIAHGQMSETELEKEMMAFLEHENDVLVCTTIIETGLDLPNVNTLIIDEADRMGLGQLYQLRGRVGRSNRKAYSYFLYKPQKVLTEVAEKRLASIREFTEFGSGLKIAMRDLEIRGAGNLIGAQQHGHMAAVGFDLYCQMLKEAVQELRGEEIEETVEPSIEVQVDAFLPDVYIQDRQVKANVYQRLGMLRDEDSLSEMIDELVDRFGTPPREVENLFEIIRIKIIAKSIKLEQVQQSKQHVVLRFSSDPGLSGERLMLLAQKSPYPLSFGTTQKGSLEIKARLRTVVQEEILVAIKKLISTVFEIASSTTP